MTPSDRFKQRSFVTMDEAAEQCPHCGYWFTVGGLHSHVLACAVHEKTYEERVVRYLSRVKNAGFKLIGVTGIFKSRGFHDMETDIAIRRLKLMLPGDIVFVKATLDRENGRWVLK